MSREITFRALFRRKTNGATAWQSLFIKKGFVATPAVATCKEWEQISDWLQFTGLLDIAGDEICENDIVYIAGLGNAIAKISPHSGLEFNRGDESASYVDAIAEKDLGAIAGNIHQNPELMEGA